MGLLHVGPLCQKRILTKIAIVKSGRLLTCAAASSSFSRSRRSIVIHTSREKRKREENKKSATVH